MESVSDIFRTPAGPYAMIEARRNGWKAGLGALAVVAVLILLSLSDFRYGVVALMVVCVVYPMILLLAWLRLTASKEMTLRMRPQRWILQHDGSLKLEFFAFQNEEGAEPEAVESRILTPDAVESVETSGKYHVINLISATTPGFYLIPSTIINQYPTLLSNL